MSKNNETENTDSNPTIIQNKTFDEERSLYAAQDVD